MIEKDADFGTETINGGEVVTAQVKISTYVGGGQNKMITGIICTKCNEVNPPSNDYCKSCNELLPIPVQEEKETKSVSILESKKPEIVLILKSATGRTGMKPGKKGFFV